MIVCSFLSAIGYAMHMVMAIMVLRHQHWKRKTGVVDVLNPEEEEARKAKARQLWIQMTSREGL